MKKAWAKQWWLDSQTGTKDIWIPIYDVWAELIHGTAPGLLLSRPMFDMDIPFSLDIGIFTPDTEEFYIIAGEKSSLGITPFLGQFPVDEAIEWESKLIQPEDLVLYSYFAYKDPLYFKLLEDYGN